MHLEPVLSWQCVFGHHQRFGLLEGASSWLYPRNPRNILYVPITEFSLTFTCIQRPKFWLRWLKKIFYFIFSTWNYTGCPQTNWKMLITFEQIKIECCGLGNVHWTGRIFFLGDRGAVTPIREVAREANFCLNSNPLCVIYHCTGLVKASKSIFEN